MRGVLGADVAFLSDLAQVKYLPHLVTRQEIQDRISQLGYSAAPLEESPRGAEKKDLLLRLGISAILTANIMMLSFALYFGFFQELDAGAIWSISFPLWLLATPVVFYGGFPILKKAFWGLWAGHASMDTLISVGVLSAYFYSMAGMGHGSLHLYFDTASMLVTLVLLGRFIESRAKEKVSAGITQLHQLAGAKVRLWHHGRERWVGSESVEAEDEILVLASEAVPVDGIVADGSGSVDESVLTGESRPVKRSLGDHVMAGSLLLDGRLRLRALKVGTESSLNQMIALMQEALSKKNPVELLADRITRVFVPLVFLLAAATASRLLYGGYAVDEAMLRALTVLVITCPCALGIATPLAKVASIGVGRAQGILIRDTEALERVKDLDVIIFDKTGTLTEGCFSLNEIIAPQCDYKETLGLLASVEAGSDHLLAREILLKAREAGVQLQEAGHFESLDGRGVVGVVQSRQVCIGNRRLLSSQGIDLPNDLDRYAATLESAGSTVVFFGWDGEARGLLVFGDVLKESAVNAVSQLRVRGVDVWIVSGDSIETTRSVAQELGIRHCIGQALPAEKEEIIRQLQTEGHRVGMVGDGINDAAALVSADVGIALGAGSHIMREASDITLLTPDLGKVLRVLKLSKITTQIIRQNLFFAFLYNILGIPLAITGALNPLVAVCAMFASSLTVVANTLRIFRQSGP